MVLLYDGSQSKPNNLSLAVFRYQTVFRVRVVIASYFKGFPSAVEDRKAAAGKEAFTEVVDRCQVIYLHFADTNMSILT
jgi:hypothetical protein